MKGRTVTDKKPNDEITPLDKEWWRQFADSFMEEGETVKDGAASASDELSRRFDDAVEKGQAKLQELLASSRSEAEASVHSALSEISQRLDRIEGHLKEKHKED